MSPQSANPKHWTPRHLTERILAEQTARATHADTDGARKTITALFADVAGFTTLTQALDPEDAPVHGNKDLKIGTLRQLLKDAGLTLDDL